MKPQVTIDLDEYNKMKAIEDGHLQNKLTVIRRSVFSFRSEVQIYFEVYNPSEYIKELENIANLSNDLKEKAERLEHELKIQSKELHRIELELHNKSKKKWWQL